MFLIRMIEKVPANHDVLSDEQYMEQLKQDIEKGVYKIKVTFKVMPSYSEAIMFEQKLSKNPYCKAELYDCDILHGINESFDENKDLSIENADYATYTYIV